MDYYNFNSEPAETLAFLRPPVQRINRNHDTERVCAPASTRSEIPTDTLLHDFRTKLSNHPQRPFEKSDTGSSTSLILKKTNEREILEQFTVVSHSNLQYPHTDCSPTKGNVDRPLIKVTVIPNITGQTQTSKYRKQRHVISKVQNTVSNQENSIKAKNVYLVVAGRKKEKIYEIKTAGSAEFSNKSITKNDDEPVALQQVKNFKQLLNSLNMDKKKKKGKKDLHRGSRTSLVNDIFEGADVILPESSKNVGSRKSRVRIMGRIGLTEDDKYVLRCNATINDKPVETRHAQLDQTQFIKPQEPSNRNLKDSNVQTGYDFEIENSLNIPQHFRINAYSKQENQATQTYTTRTDNALCLSNIDTLKIFARNDQTVQCCTKGGTNMKIPEMESDFDSPHTSSSPLVIISVYPKQEAQEINKNNKYPMTDNRNRSPSKQNQSMRLSMAGKQKPESNNNINDNKSPRARSPSPLKKFSKLGIQAETRVIRTIMNRELTNSQSKVNKETTNTKLKTNREYSNAAATAQKFHKMENPRGKIAQETKVSKVSPDFEKHPKNINIKQQTPRSQGTNTDHLLTKKALVDTYTKKISEHMNQKKGTKSHYSPRNDVSNVSVESDNEYYDFLFRQGNLTTDLRFRKTLKDQGSEKNHHMENESPSLENFLLFTETNGSQRKRSFSQTFLLGGEDDQTADDPLTKIHSRLTVRDSIEISHRREERNSTAGFKSPQLNITSQNSKYSNEFLSESSDRNIYASAPYKHYRGDSCSILDPFQRDKEIRELLGVNTRPKTSRSKIAEKSAQLKADQPSMQCFYQLDSQHLIAEIEESLCSFYRNREERACDIGVQTDKSRPVENATKTSQQQSFERTQASEQSSGSFQESCQQIHKLARQPSSPLAKSPIHRTPHKAEQRPPYRSPYQPDDQPVEQLTLLDTRQQHPLYQQLILNRNINIYLQIEQFTKQKPIVLSRRQYNKVKRTIESAALRKPKMCIYKKYSSVSIGQVRRKPRQITQAYTSYKPRVIETPQRKDVSERQIVNTNKFAPRYTPDKNASQKKYKDDEQKKRNKACECKSESSKDERAVRERKEYNVEIPYRGPWRRELKQQTHNFTKNCVQKAEDYILGCPCCEQAQTERNNFWGTRQPLQENRRQFCFHSKVPTVRSSTKNHVNSSRNAASSVEICYTSVAYRKHVSFSSTKVEASTPSMLNTKTSSDVEVPRADSILTIFKGHRKTPTPNLGTSAYSLLSDNSYKSPDIEVPLESKPRKPFLSRLMSFLVMRSARESAVKMRKPVQKLTSVNSSIDSYHINTSLGAIELSSSIYDTSASFYSNHTIMPINSKMKRGFLSSMRGFLTTRRS